MATLTKQQAIEMLPVGKIIHVFKNPNGMLLGADWTRDEVLKLIEGAEAGNIKEAGEMAQKLGHGLAVLSEGNWNFIETKELADRS